MPTFKLEIDFLADAARELRAALADEGCKVDELCSCDDVFAAYFSHLGGRVPTAPRQVRYATDFPRYGEHASALEEIEAAVRDGKDLLRFQSHRVLDVSKTDLMQVDWGIWHFHLGRQRMSNGFVQRTGDLLFAMFDSETAYFGCIRPHGHWCETSIVEQFFREWPELSRRYRMQSISGDPIDFSDHRVRQLRGKNINAPIVLSDGSVMAAPGGGYTLCGKSVQARMQSDKLANNLLDWQTMLQARFIKHAECFGIGGLLRVSISPVRHQRGFWSLRLDSSECGHDLEWRSLLDEIQRENLNG